MASELVNAVWGNQAYAAAAALSIGFLYRAYTYTLDVVLANEEQQTKLEQPYSTQRPKLVHSSSGSTIIPVHSSSSHTVIELGSPSAAEEKSTWDEDSDGSLSDCSDEDSDTSSSPPSPLFDRLRHFPLPPPASPTRAAFDEPIFVDLRALRAPIKTNLGASQRIQKMISQRMSSSRTGGRQTAKCDELRRAVLENEGRREARRIDEERWERSRRAWEEERRNGEVVIGAFEV